MTATIATAERVKAELNFAADRSEDGVWSNFTPEIRTQKLEGVTVEFTDARSLDPPASLDREGFELRRVPLETYKWDDQSWIEQVYVPHALEFIQALTGAPYVAPFHGGAVLIRDAGKQDAVPVADFVHLDQTRASVQPFIDRVADDGTRRRLPRIKLFNLWRVITPPPQDISLAICDQRTVDERDWVIGRTVEPMMPEGVPYTSSVFNPGQKWYFYPDATPDDVILFNQYDNAAGAPMGCLHGAFANPLVKDATVPRASAELRIFALFEE